MSDYTSDGFKIMSLSELDWWQNATWENSGVANTVLQELDLAGSTGIASWLGDFVNFPGVSEIAAIAITAITGNPAIAASIIGAIESTADFLEDNDIGELLAEYLSDYSIDEFVNGLVIPVIDEPVLVGHVASVHAAHLAPIRGTDDGWHQLFTIKRLLQWVFLNRSALYEMDFSSTETRQKTATAIRALDYILNDPMRRPVSDVQDIVPYDRSLWLQPSAPLWIQQFTKTVYPEQPDAQPTVEWPKICACMGGINYVDADEFDFAVSLNSLPETSEPSNVSNAIAVGGIGALLTKLFG